MFSFSWIHLLFVYPARRYLFPVPVQYPKDLRHAIFDKRHPDTYNCDGGNDDEEEHDHGVSDLDL